MNPSPVIVIPARLESTRLKHKLIENVEGKPLLYYTIRAALKMDWPIIVAYDDNAILQQVLLEYFPFNTRVDFIHSPQNYQNGTQRICSLYNHLHALNYTNVINLQGDYPTVPVSVIENVCEAMSPERRIVTACTFFKDEEEWLDSNNSKMIVTNVGKCLYASRCPIPYGDYKSSWKHLGVYGYYTVDLPRIQNLPNVLPSENLEQNSFIGSSLGLSSCICPSELAQKSFSIDTKHDLERFRNYERQKNLS